MFNIFWTNVTSNALKKPVAGQINLWKWKWIGHNLEEKVTLIILTWNYFKILSHDLLGSDKFISVVQ
jgi:hypothetical protein